MLTQQHADRLTSYVAVCAVQVAYGALCRDGGCGGGGWQARIGYAGSCFAGRFQAKA